MALFKFRWPGRQESSEPGGKSAQPGRRARAPQAESIEDMRRRARHRLMGAAVLVLVGVVGFPLLFDSQPRPIPVDVAIRIPDRNKVAPLAFPQADGGAGQVDGKGLAAGEELLTAPAPVPQPAEAKAPAAPQAPKPPPPVQAPAAEPHETRPQAKAEPARAEAPAPKVEHKAEPRREPRPEPAAEAKHPVAAADSGARARALLEGRASAPPEPAAAAGGRFIVQVGAFADEGKVAEVRSRLERLGLKTYTQAVNASGKRTTRVRLGPFNSRADADKAAERAKSAGLAAAVLTL